MWFTPTVYIFDANVLYEGNFFSTCSLLSLDHSCYITYALKYAHANKALLTSRTHFSGWADMWSYFCRLRFINYIIDWEIFREDANTTREECWIRRGIGARNGEGEAIFRGTVLTHVYCQHLISPLQSASLFSHIVRLVYVSTPLRIQHFQSPNVLWCSFYYYHATVCLVKAQCASFLFYNSRSVTKWSLYSVQMCV